MESLQGAFIWSGGELIPSPLLQAVQDLIPVFPLITADCKEAIKYVSALRGGPDKKHHEENSLCLYCEVPLTESCRSESISLPF